MDAAVNEHLRYHFANNPEMTKMSIVDSQAQSQTQWVLDRSVQMATNNYRDYAIIARSLTPIPANSRSSLRALAAAAPSLPASF